MWGFNVMNELVCTYGNIIDLGGEENFNLEGLWQVGIGNLGLVSIYLTSQMVPPIGQEME